MDLEFWNTRWRNNQIGFHQPEVNGYLRDHIGQASERRVFVPLCGKSLDLIWLASQGFEVIGVECSEIAVRNFFAENGLDFETTGTADAAVFQNGNIRIHLGDYFDLTAEQLGPVTDVFDRASLIALPGSMRPDYVRKLMQLTPRNVQILLVTLNYPQEQKDGPPFAVDDDEVDVLFGDCCTVEPLCQTDILSREPRFREQGLTRLVETAFRIGRHSA